MIKRNHTIKDYFKCIAANDRPQTTGNCPPLVQMNFNSFRKESHFLLKENRNTIFC